MKRLLFILAITVAASAPSWALRIVSLLPSNTEILEALGAGDEIVGVTQFDRPVAGRDRVGDFIHPNMEKIVALKPDLVVGGEWKSSRSMIRLRALGYPVVEIANPRSLNDIYASIQTLAKAIGRPDAAAPVIARMKSEFAAIAANAKTHPRRRVFIEIDDGPWTPGGPDFITEACALAGLDNVFSDLASQAAHVSNEAVVQRDPEVVISLHAPAAALRARAGWERTTAVRNGWIIDGLNEDAFVRPSPGLPKAIADVQRRAEAFR